MTHFPRGWSGSIKGGDTAMKSNVLISLIVSMVVVPVLEKLATDLEEKAKKTPETWDDVLCGAFKTVVEALRSPGFFSEK